MPITQWCWRCQADVPMLDEAEWQSVAPLLGSSIEAAKRFGRNNIFGFMALAKYENLTARKEKDLNVVRHHRASLYGPPCTKCGKPLRTPQANLCAACGQARVR